MPKLLSTDEYLMTLDERFVSSACRGDCFTVQYDLNEPDGLTFFVTIDDGTMEAERGSHPAPDVRIETSGRDFVALVNGELGGKRAFFSGRLKFSGDLPKAMKLEKIFPKDSKG